MASRLTLLLLVPLLASCGTKAPQREDSSLPFVFRSLNLRQQDQAGRLKWEMTSPEARYDLRRRVAQALSPRGVIYRDGKPIYRLQASSGTVINDGQVILLEGDIRVEQLGAKPVLIRASRVRWNPADNEMDFDRHPEALDPSNRITATTARFLISRNQLELRGSPRLEHWTRRFDPFRPGPRGKPEVVIDVSRADWDPPSGELNGKGPVKARRWPPGTSANHPPQLLTASAIDGFTTKQQYRLLGPVRFVDSAEGTTFEANELAINLADRTLSSTQPFSGRRGTLQVTGQSLQVLGKDTTVVIPSGCFLQQPGDTLRAESCRWNWTTQEVQADGGLEVQRSVQRQSTTGQQLRGRLGDQGQLDVRSPGGRVVSRFQVPRRQAPPPPSPRPAPEPIRL